MNMNNKHGIGGQTGRLFTFSYSPYETIGWAYERPATVTDTGCFLLFVKADASLSDDWVSAALSKKNIALRLKIFISK